MIENTIISLLIFLPEIISVLGLVLLIKRILFLNNSREVLGEVTGLEARQTNSQLGVSTVPGNRRAVFHPIIYFKDNNGNKHRLIVGQVGRYLSYNNGDKVLVLYNLSKPSEALLKNLYCIWVVPVSFLAIGILSMKYKYF